MANEQGIKDLSGLEHAVNLTTLILNDNSISDVRPLASLIDLERLRLKNNAIRDVSPLASLEKLTELSLDNNPVSDFSQLESLPNLSFDTLASLGLVDRPQGRLKRIRMVDYEILPPGWWREKDSPMVNQLRRQFKTKKEFGNFMDRLDFADSKGPIELYTSKFNDQGYQYYLFVYQNHVLAECPQYGNAAYVLKGTDGWQDIFWRSRQELRKNFSHRVTWIRHTKTWKERLAEYLN
jgi:Leucine-rich repeat (LRR) protein